MPEKTPLEKLQEVVTGLVKGAVADPVGTAGKAAHQARGVLSLGLMAAGQAAQTVADRLMRSPTPPPSAPRAPVVDRETPPTPADVARVVEMKPPTQRAAPRAAPQPRGKTAAGAGRATPSDKLPVKKAPAKKAPAKKAPAKKAPAKKAPAKKAPAKKPPAGTEG